MCIVCCKFRESPGNSISIQTEFPVSCRCFIWNTKPPWVNTVWEEGARPCLTNSACLLPRSNLCLIYPSQLVRISHVILLGNVRKPLECWVNITDSSTLNLATCNLNSPLEPFASKRYVQNKICMEAILEK